MQSPIPSIDLQQFLSGSESEQTAIARQVDDVCRSIGFLIVENHGVPASLIDNVWTLSRAFFDLPLDNKLRSRADDPTCPRGYFPAEAEALAKSHGVDTPPDIKESFSCGPLRGPDRQMNRDEFEFHYGENIWPTEPDGFKHAWIDYYNAMETLGSKIMMLFATALELPYDYFDRFYGHHISALRGINYPERTEALLPGQRAAGEHSDYGSVTILKPDEDVPGLEIRLPTGEWAAAPLVRNAFIINIGDMMARWTNERWVSTLHRVVSAPDDDGLISRRRQSLAYFQNTDYDARIQCLPTCVAEGERPIYAPVEAGQYLINRFTAAIK